MPAWIRTTLYGIMLLCCGVIGTGVYLEIATPDTGVDAEIRSHSFPDELPSFTLNDVWDEPHSIEEWSGKPLLINFWATWCAPCRREMPLLQALHNDQTAAGLTVLGIAIDRRPDVQRYIAEAGISYPILSGEIDAMAGSDLFGLPGLGLPLSVQVSSNGQILTVFIGEIEMAEIREMVAISQAVEAQELAVNDARASLEQLANK